MLKRFYAAMKDEKGQGLAEYSLILVLVSVAAVATLTALGVSVTGVFTQVVGAL